MKKNIPIVVIITMLFISSGIKAQLVYQKKIYELPAPRFSLLFNTEKAVDSGYIISGGSSTTANLAGFMFLAKINELGDTVWTRQYDGPEYEYGYIKNLYDSSYVVYGQLYSFNPCDQEDMFLMKLNANGDTLWTKHYGTCYPDNPKKLVKAPNNGYYLLGTLDDGSNPLGSILLRLNAQGDTVWTRLIDISGVGLNLSYSCTSISDGGLILVGSVFDASSAPYSSFLIKIDSSGNLQWDKYINAPYFNQIYQIIPTSNGYVIIGGCNLGGALGSGTMLLKTDINGNPLWGRMYENIIIGQKNAALLLSDGTIFFSGAKRRGPVILGQNNNDLVSFKTDSIGNLIWAKKYVTNQLGFGAYSSISSLQTNDNGFLISTTSTTDPTYNTYNGFLAKIDSLGNGCSDSVLTINVVDITSMIVTSDTINPVVSYYPVTVGYSPFNYYGSGIKYTDLCNGYVGIEEQNNFTDDKLKIYPNPAQSKLTIEFEIEKTETNSILIKNVLGQTVKIVDIKQLSNGENKVEIDISNLQSGLYFIKMQLNKTHVLKKFIKQ